MDDLTLRAIDCVFEIMEDIEKSRKLDDLQKRLSFNSDFFSYSAFLNANQDRLVNFLDRYFYDLLGDFDPVNDMTGGLVTYTIYDAATPYIDGKPYNLKEKSEFIAFVKSSTVDQHDRA